MSRPARTSRAKSGRTRPSVIFRPGPVVVERARDPHRQALVLREGHAERLAEALALVVARARAGAGHVAAVRLGRRDRVRRRVAVDLARGVEEEAGERPPRVALGDRVVEEIAEAVDVGVDALHGLRAVVHRGGDARRVDHVVEVAHVLRQRLDHVVAREREVGIGRARLEPRRHAAHVVVEHGHVDRSAAARLVPVERRLHQVVAEEAAAAGDQELSAGERAELFAEVDADRLEIRLEELRE
jgi:hypothetical protein